MEILTIEKFTIAEKIIIPLLSIILSVVFSLIAIHADYNRQYKKGVLQFNEIIKRYFTIVYNSFDAAITPPRLKTQPIEKIYYLEELKAIDTDLSKLVENPYYTKLLEKYQDLSMISILLRREIVDLKKIDKLVLKPDNIDTLFMIYQAVKENLPKKTRKDKVFKESDKMINKIFQPRMSKNNKHNLRR